MLKKSPSGSLCPYHYMGGELHPLKYGSYFDDKIRLFDVIKAEEEFILQSSGLNNRRIWVDLYETTLDDEVVTFLIDHIKSIRHKIFNLCFIGCSKRDCRKFKSKMMQENIDFFNQAEFFSDPEDGKQWLLGKLKK